MAHQRTQPVYTDPEVSRGEEKGLGRVQRKAERQRGSQGHREAYDGTLTKGKNRENSWNQKYHATEFCPSEGSQERAMLCLWGRSLAVIGKTVELSCA